MRVKREISLAVGTARAVQVQRIICAEAGSLYCLHFLHECPQMWSPCEACEGLPSYCQEVNCGCHNVKEQREVFFFFFFLKKAPNVVFVSMLACHCDSTSKIWPLDLFVFQISTKKFCFMSLMGSSDLKESE